VISAAILSLLVAIPDQDAGARRVPHPGVPCWQGWTGPTASGAVVYDTRDDIQPFRVAHDRDQIRRGANVEQDYNYVVYWFGDPSSPIQARYYLRNDEGVGVILPGDSARLSLAQARERFPADVLCYLQRRFDRIEVLVADGYRELWVRPQ
jgi:hypothetical protein